MSRKKSVVVSSLCFKHSSDVLCHFVALLRHATACSQLQSYQTAMEDLNKVLCVEPGNAVAKVRTNAYIECD